MRIVIETRPMAAMRYRTPGDYWVEEDGSLYITVAEELGDDMAFLVAIHELAEFWLTRKHGMSEELITMFDEEFEKARKPGDESEPGDSPQAPYHIEHGFATSIERMMCAALGINWKEYEDRCINIMEEYDVKRN